MKYTCVQCVSHIVDACACSGARCGCSRWERGKIASISSYNTTTTPTLLQHQHCSMYNTNTAPQPTRPTRQCFSRSPPASKSQQPRHCRRDHSRIWLAFRPNQPTSHCARVLTTAWAMRMGWRIRNNRRWASPITLFLLRHMLSVRTKQEILDCYQ